MADPAAKDARNPYYSQGTAPVAYAAPVSPSSAYQQPGYSAQPGYAVGYTPAYPQQQQQYAQPQYPYPPQQQYAQPQPQYTPQQPGQYPPGYGAYAQPVTVVVDQQLGGPKSGGYSTGPVVSAAPVVTGASYTESMMRAVRQGFIRKVYSVLCIQLLVTFGIVAVFTFSEPVKAAVQANVAILFVAIFLSFGFLIALACCPGVAKSFPGNYICLTGFTLCESYLVGAIASFYSTDAVLMAIGGTVIITTALTIYAWQTKIDFTAMGGTLLVILLVFVLFGLVMAVDHSRVMRTVYAAIGLLIFSLFLVYDTQMIIGGDRALTYGPDDYILAALNVYVDVIQIFLFLLRLFGSRD